MHGPGNGRFDWERERPRADTPGAAVRMRWADLVFLNWRVDPGELDDLLPGDLRADRFDGDAWISLVPFQMDRVRFRGVPPLPGLQRFLECNVRTYVTVDGVPGVWFFSLDAESRFAVMGGRTIWSLNYRLARMRAEHEGATRAWSIERNAGDGRSRIRVEVGERIPPAGSGSLRHFLTERYSLYAARGERLYRGAVFHEPWPLREARVLELDDELVAASGVTGCTIDNVVALAADPVDVLGWSKERIR